MADREDTEMDAMKPTLCDSMLDCSPAEAERFQLIVRNNAVLGLGDRDHSHVWLL